MCGLHALILYLINCHNNYLLNKCKNNEMGELIVISNAKSKRCKYPRCFFKLEYLKFKTPTNDTHATKGNVFTNAYLGLIGCDSIYYWMSLTEEKGSIRLLRRTECTQCKGSYLCFLFGTLGHYRG